MPGPPKTPTKVLEMRGSWRAKLRPAEPTPRTPRRLAVPKDLNVAEKTLWGRLMRDLSALQLLAGADRYILERYCALFVRWQVAMAAVRQYGETYWITREDGGKEQKEFAHTRRVVTLSRELLRIEAQFGMTPSARAHLGQVLSASEAQKHADHDPKARLFRHKA